MALNRFIIIISSLVLAYFATWAGSAYGVAVASVSVTSISAFVLFVAAVALFAFAIGTVIDDMDRDQSAILAACCLISAAAFFGIVATPMEMGLAPWHWNSAWAIMPVAAMTPVALVLKRCAIDFRIWVDMGPDGRRAMRH
jgi:hypothetical protein